jgi:hypothetical protein
MSTPNRSPAATTSWFAIPAVADFHGDWVRLNDKRSCRFSWVNSQVRCVWNTPRPPSANQVSKVLAAYRAARQDFARQLAARIGAQVVFVDRYGWVASS